MSDLLDILSITHVVTVLDKALSDLSPLDPRIARLHISDVADDSRHDLMQYFDQCIAFISHALADGKRCLVHCQQGVSRSASLLIAYFIRTQGMSLTQALETIRACRDINPNFGFMRQLRNFEHDCLHHCGNPNQTEALENLIVGPMHGSVQDQDFKRLPV